MKSEIERPKVSWGIILKKFFSYKSFVLREAILQAFSRTRVQKFYSVIVAD